MYGAGQYCRSDDDCISGSELEGLMQTSRDYDELEEYWTGWRTIAPPMREKYERYVELANEGAGELGYGDLGEMWRAGYDMSPAEFEGEATRLWEQVKPLYDELHCAVRSKLGEHYGEDKVPQDGPIPAHLLGNMWAQGWGSLYDIMEPYAGVSDLDVDSTLQTKNYSPQEMVRSAESFYVSLGMDRLPQTFWERSQFTKPRDREVVCHASAWGLDGGNDLRIKMCIKPTYDELRVIYHELGHNYYQAAYKDQPPLFQGCAHSGFHEAIGDTVTLSMTPDYLKQVGLVDSAEENEQAVINRQMQMALDKIGFLPFGKLIDEWRWGVFSGEITPENYNQAWWDLRPSIRASHRRTSVAKSTLIRARNITSRATCLTRATSLLAFCSSNSSALLCETAGHEGDLASCSIFGSKEAGDKFYAMMASGQSEPWQDALEKLTGTREMDATAIIDYFAPLMGYLKEENAGRSCGW